MQAGYGDDAVMAAMMAADMAHGGREWEEVCVETFHLSKALEKPFLNLASCQSTYSWCHLET